MSQMPNYLKTETNKYKGDVAEKIASEYLKRMNYTCKSYSEVSDDFVVSDSSYTYHTVHKSLFDNEIKKQKGHLKRFKKSLKKYSSEVPPRGLKWEGTLTWEEYRKRQLEYGEWHIENVKQSIKQLEQREKRIKKTWGRHLVNLKRYVDWLGKFEHHPKHPDFVALKEGKVYVIEVKSQTKGRRAFFSKYQREALRKASEFGFRPMLLIVPVDINIEIGEPKITVIESQA